MSITANLFKQYLGEEYDQFDSNNSRATRLLEEVNKDKQNDEPPPSNKSPSDLEEVGIQVLECNDSEAKKLEKAGFTVAKDRKSATKGGKKLTINDALKSLKEDVNMGDEPAVISNPDDITDVSKDFEDDYLISDDGDDPDSDDSDSDEYYYDDEDEYEEAANEGIDEAIRHRAFMSAAGGHLHKAFRTIHKLPPKPGYVRKINPITGAEKYVHQSAAQKHSLHMHKSMHARRAAKLAWAARRRLHHK